MCIVIEEEETTVDDNEAVVDDFSITDVTLLLSIALSLFLFVSRRRTVNVVEL